MGVVALLLIARGPVDEERKHSYNVIDIADWSCFFAHINLELLINQRFSLPNKCLTLIELVAPN